MSYSKSTIRRTSSGRIAIPNYQPPAYNGEDITDSLDIKAASMLELGDSEMRNKMEQIRRFVKEMGFDSILQACIKEMELKRSEDNKRKLVELRKDMNDLVEACLNNPLFKPLNNKVSTSLCQAASRIFQHEAASLSQLDDIRVADSGYSRNNITNYSFIETAELIAKTAPCLSEVLNDLVDTSTVSGSESQLDDTVDDTERQPFSIGDPQLYNMKDRRIHRRKASRKKICVSVAIAILLYTRSQKVNLMQSHIGYFLFASKTSKRVIEVLHRLGISKGYESITDTLRVVAAEASENLQSWAAEHPPFFGGLDNLNHHNRVTGQTLYNQSTMQNQTVAYMAQNPKVTLNRMLQIPEFGRAKIVDLTAEHFFSHINRHEQRKAFQVGIFKTLSEYCGAHIPVYPEKAEEGGRSLKPFKYKEIYPLPIQRTRIMTFPVFDLNEGKLEEIVTVLRRMFGWLQYNFVKLQGKGIMVIGDQLTVSNMR